MKPTDFAKYISDFLTKYLLNEKGASRNTISSYRDAFILLIDFIQTKKQIKLEKITLEKITKSTILDFLDWLQNERKCSISTRNSRLAAIHSFYKLTISAKVYHPFRTKVYH
jgi:site-specific recombinase XerD